MNEEILNADGTRNFQANILLDNVKRLEQENEQLKTRLKLYIKAYKILQEIKEIAEEILYLDRCNNCDGVGIDMGCIDTDCAYYQMEKILQKITKAEV